MNIISMIIKKGLLIILASGFVFTSCEDYLDKAPESIYTENDVFGSFVSFQGFVEEMYNCVVDVAKINNTSAWWYADEFVSQRATDNHNRFDQGNYQPNQFSQLTGDFNPSEKSALSKRIWPGGWYVIRKANLGLANMGFLKDATQEEKDIIAGQLYFFRGYNHLELMTWWGGLPYIDVLLTPEMGLKIPRPTFEEAAVKAHKDFIAAAELLPEKWDETEAGKRTLGNNVQRVNKSTAYGYAGKSLLYAASPLMQKASKKAAEYDADLCKKAAEAFAEVIRLSEEKGVFGLQPFETYIDQFHIQDAAAILPGGVEVMWGPTIHNANVVRFNMHVVWNLQQLGGQSFTNAPCHSYIQNFGMANGLPLDDPESGYDPLNPWDNRDPRFYKIHVLDGDRLANASSAGVDQFAQFFRGGRHRAAANGTMTGYLTKKYIPMPGYNSFDGFGVAWSVQMRPPYMRLADIYLMYAEAVLHGYGSATASHPGSMTAVEALNKVRARAGVPGVDSKYTVSKEAFMGIIIQERAVELAYETHRFHDLRRWLLAGSEPYLTKTELLFDRDPVTKKPINIEERVIRKRVFEDKHWWMPLPVNQVTIYEEFYQNPGW
jgi:starch-binding outer membrane protein, SusD/RagB family